MADGALLYKKLLLQKNIILRKIDCCCDYVENTDFLYWWSVLLARIIWGGLFDADTAPKAAIKRNPV